MEGKRSEVVKERARPQAPTAISKTSELKCFNCNMRGHTLSECSKQMRPKGSCYNCGSLNHQINICPKKQQQQRQKSQNGNRTRTAVEAEEKQTTLLVDWKPTAAFMVDVRLVREECERDVSCIVDTGSPISLINFGFVKGFPFIHLGSACNHFEGINQTKLEISGTIDLILIVSIVKIKLTLYVVHGFTMSYKCLLGRDFVSHDELKVSTSGKKIHIYPSDEISSELISIMNINYVDKNEQELNVNPNILPSDRKKYLTLFTNIM